MRRNIFWIAKVSLSIITFLVTFAVIYLLGRYILGIHLLSSFWRRLVFYLSFILIYNVFLENTIDRLSDLIAKKISKQ